MLRALMRLQYYTSLLFTFLLNPFKKASETQLIQGIRFVGKTSRCYYLLLEEIDFPMLPTIKQYRPVF